MIVDLILDRKDNESAFGKDLYFSIKSLIIFKCHCLCKISCNHESLLNMESHMDYKSAC